MGTNSFSGPLPSELGNLTKLKTLMQNVKTPPGFIIGDFTILCWIYGQPGVSGEIPSTLANLRNPGVVGLLTLNLQGKDP
ncbi:hypothetical protein Patl1_06833 [Pistacia atlantica]|uniref:Uncharacterized protein n=1 Tax=Pistacia atlantica TaxID=434234 RepID=A0ACC1AHN8_9ROSI|nr:hypothetical protein Patl1_06833 [Pistacia atlantica]